MARNGNTELGASVEELTSGPAGAETDDEDNEVEEVEVEWSEPKNDRDDWDTLEEVQEQAEPVELLTNGGQTFEAWALDKGEDAMCRYAILYVPEVKLIERGNPETQTTTAWIKVAEFKDAGTYKVEGFSHDADKYMFPQGQLGQAATVRDIRGAQ